MRILHLLNDVQQLGNGIIHAAIDLACLQAKAGHEVSVASAGGEYEELLSKYGVQHFELDQSRRPITLLKAAWHYRSLIRTMQPDIVHAHMMTGVVLASALRFTTYKLVSTVHNEFQRSAILMGLADRVIAVSQAVADSMQQRGIPRTKLRVVKNGTIGTPRSLQSSVSQAPALHRPAITTVAGMQDRKGIAELIAAFEQVAARFPAVHLYLVGDGPDRAKYEQQVQHSPYRDRLHFAGFQPDPFAYLQATDIFVLASRREPFGLVLAEAREAGCAIVASDVDGIPEALDGGKAGILVPPADTDAIAAALQTLLTQPDQLRYWQHQGQQNLEWLTVGRVYRETIDVYQELLIADTPVTTSLPTLSKQSH